MKTKTKMSKGFTTVELLFAMAIIGILTTYGIKNGTSITEKAFEFKAKNSEFYAFAIAERNLKIATINDLKNETYTKNGYSVSTQTECLNGEYGFQMEVVDNDKEYSLEGSEDCSSDKVDGEVIYFDQCDTDGQMSITRKGVCYGK